MGGFSGFSDEGVPLIVSRRGEANGWEDAITVTHEAEHIKNRILRDGRNKALWDHEMDNETLPKLRERDERSLPMEESAKDEILAMLSALQVYESSQMSPEQIDKLAPDFFEKFGGMITEELAQPGGHYYETFREAHYPTEQELARYRQHVTRSIESYAQLWHVCRESGKFNRKEIAYMTSSILEQFPLSKWPGVARLFKN